MQIDYDSRYDTLTITFRTSKHTICVENKNGVLYRVDPFKEKLLGITILGFSKRSGELGGFKLTRFFDVVETPQLTKECKSLRKAMTTPIERHLLQLRLERLKKIRPEQLS